MTPRPALLVLGASLLTLVAALVMAASAGGVAQSTAAEVRSVGARPQAADAASSSGPSANQGGSDRGATTSARPSPPVRVVRGPGPANPAQAAGNRVGSRPVLVRIPRLGVTAEVVPVGVTPDGQVRVPDDVARVGWYRFGPTPGASRGSTVLVGHRDGLGQGEGALYGLGGADVGDRVLVTRSDGRVVRYRVVAREALDKAGLPVRELFARSGQHRLTVITCGGAYDAQAGGYVQNVVVTAVPDPDGGRS
ncbi:MAG: class F sortase [Candidatus Nanopelagicales bacterium]